MLLNIKKRNLSPKFPKLSRWTRFLLFCCFVVLLSFLIISFQKLVAGKKQKQETRTEKNKLCPHRFSEPGKDIVWEQLRLITGWDCDYCGQRMIQQKNDYLKNYLLKKEEQLAVIEKHLVECKEAQKVVGNLNKNGNYDNEKSLKEKGYSSETIRQLKGWGLMDRVNLPNLDEEKRKSSVKVLGVISKEGSEVWVGKVNDLVIFLVPRSTPITHQNFPELINKKQRPDFFYTIHSGSRETATYERIVVASFVWKVLEKEKSWNYNIFILETDKDNTAIKLSPIHGNSASTAWYLGLLSAYHQKPISQKVATTASIDIGKCNNFRCNECFQENELAENPKENFSKNGIGKVKSEAKRS